MAEEREVSAKLKISKEGDENAFKETAVEIQQLDKAAAASGSGLDTLAEKEGEAAEAAGALGTSVSGAGRAATQATGPMDNLGEATKKAGDKALTGREKFEDLFLKIGVSMQVLHEAQRALQMVEESLNDVSKMAGGTGDEFDGLGSKLGAFTASITQFINKVGNIDDAFAAFSNTNGSLIERLDAAKEALDGLSPSAQKLKDAITGTDDELVAEAEALGRVIGQMENAGEVHEREAGRIGEALAKMAQKAEEAGVDLGASFDAQLKKYPELDSASAKRAKTLEAEGDAAKDSAKVQSEAYDEIQQASTDAGAGLDEAQQGAADLGQAADTSKGGVAALSAELKELPSATTGLQDAISAVSALTLDALLASVEQLRSALQGATSDANDLQSALLAADTAGPAPAAPGAT